MQFRYARHTDNITALIQFYTSILQLQVLGEFKEHDGYDGVFLGRLEKDWHLEFTSNNKAVVKEFDSESPLVFYVSSLEFDHVQQAVKSKSLSVFEHPNPYWKKNNAIFTKDPDGYPVIVVNKNFKP